MLIYPLAVLTWTSSQSRMRSGLGTNLGIDKANKIEHSVNE